MLPVGVCTTRHWQTSGRPVQELNFCPVALLSCSFSCCQVSTTVNSIEWYIHNPGKLLRMENIESNALFSIYVKSMFLYAIYNCGVLYFRFVLPLGMPKLIDFTCIQANKPTLYLSVFLTNFIRIS